MSARLHSPLLLCLVPMLLAGCDFVNTILGPDPTVLRQAEANAIGSACRYSNRNIEDCYILNPKANKAAMFNGWKEMDAYMRENKIEGTPAMLVKPPAAPAPAASSAEEAVEEKPGKAAPKAH